MTNRLIGCVTNCTDTNAAGRMEQEVHYECETPFVSLYHATHMLEAGGNMIDAMRRSNGILCNSAPRFGNGDENGSPIVFGVVEKVGVVSTRYALPLYRKMFPEVDDCLRVLNIPQFLERVGRLSDLESQYRGQTVMPLLLSHVLKATPWLADVSGPILGSISVIDPPAVWLVDRIDDRPTNVKLTTLASELPSVQPGQPVNVRIETRRGKTRQFTLPFRASLNAVPQHTIGIYPGSSGYKGERFLEIAESGGSAAIKYGLKIGDGVSVWIGDAPPQDEE